MTNYLKFTCLYFSKGAFPLRSSTISPIQMQSSTYFNKFHIKIFENIQKNARLHRNLKKNRTFVSQLKKKKTDRVKLSIESNARLFVKLIVDWLVWSIFSIFLFIHSCIYVSAKGKISMYRKWTNEGYYKISGGFSIPILHICKISTIQINELHVLIAFCH